MSHSLRALVLPTAQRRTLDELTSDLDLTGGDRRAKQSAFWTMLTLSAVIASAGVLADSTATVIGAMIIAPLSTPIMGIALGLARRERLHSIRFVLAGAALVILIGLLFSAVLPGSYVLLNNSQIAGRTSPGLLDLVAAIATGFAGAVALARRDVAAVLPGVAIAISLVPPLAVVGVCFGRGEFGLGLGALLLFVSNLLSLVLAGTLIFAVLGYTAEAAEARHSAGGPRRRIYLTLGLLLSLVMLPLLANTVANALIAGWTDSTHRIADEWLAGTPGAETIEVESVGGSIVISARTPGELPPTQDLLERLKGEIPAGIPIVVKTTEGAQIEAGDVPNG